MADPISEPTIAPISPAVAEAMNEGVRNDDEAPAAREQGRRRTRLPHRTLVEMRRPLRQSLGNPTLSRKTVSSHSRSQIFGSATRMVAVFL